MYIHQNQVWLYTTKSVPEITTDFELAGVVIPTPGDQDKVQENAAYTKRQNQLALSKEVTWICILRTPLTDESQSKLLPTEVSLRVQLTRADNSRVITTTTAEAGKYRVVITDIQLIVPKVRLNNPSHMTLETLMHGKDAVYRINRFQSTYITLPQGIQTTVLENMLSGSSPICSWITMLESDRFLGKEHLSVTKYGDFKMREIKYHLEEEQDIREPIRVTPTDVSNAVLALYEGLGVLNNPYQFIPITADNFNKGYQFYLFNHTNNLEISKYDALQELKRGNMRFQLELTSTLAAPTVVIIHMVFVSTIRITGDRRILHDF
jgi:hypothetical protein